MDSTAELHYVYLMFWPTSIDTTTVQALLGIEGVVETAVLGLKDVAAGQKVVAVIAKGQAQMLEVDTIRRHLLGELSAFKVPKEFYFVDREDLPRTPSQKIKKPELISMIERGGACRGTIVLW